MPDYNPLDLEQLSDEELVEYIQAEEDRGVSASVFGILVKRHTNHIFNFIHQYLPQKENAEDATQDTFLKTWKYISKFNQGQRFLPWLFTIARNTALDQIKKKHTMTFSELESLISSHGNAGISGNTNNYNDGNSLESSFIMQDPEPLPTEIFERTELSKELANAMNTLPPDYRVILAMHYEEDMTFEDIAEVLDRPMNTVKSWHRRAIFQIREQFRNFIDQNGSNILDK
jgi:RNA polymerase sigma-70 factor (ECF subfamily)